MKECVEHGIGKDDYDYINACTIHVCTIVHTIIVCTIVNTSVITWIFLINKWGIEASAVIGRNECARATS